MMLALLIFTSCTICDATQVLEEVMQSLIILPLKDHLKKVGGDFLPNKINFYHIQVFLEDFTSSGSLQLVAENINFSLSLSASEFRVPTTFLPKLRDTTDLCRRNFTTMASLYSPSAKLDLLLSTISSLLSSSSTSSLVPLSVPSFCSLLAYLVVHTGVETLEVEIKLRKNYKCKKCNQIKGGSRMDVGSPPPLLAGRPGWLLPLSPLLLTAPDQSKYLSILVETKTDER